MGRAIPHWYDWKVLVPLTITPILIGLVITFAFPAVVQRFRSAETDVVMLASPAPIDGKRAFGYLEKICEIGPRVAGSPENARQRKMVADHFTKMGGKVREQPFQAENPLTRQPVEMVNLIGSWHPERLQRVLISAHYDTRPHADQEDDPDRHGLPFLGANDCALGVALLMEIAHHLDKMETTVGVDLILFDGEELVYGDRPRKGEYFLGSWAFARAYAKEVERPENKSRYVAGILLDMVGGRDQKLRREPNSMEFAPALVREVWAVARQVGANRSSARSAARCSTITCRSTTPVSPPSTSSTSSIRSGTRRMTCPRIARPRAWPKSVAC